MTARGRAAVLSLLLACLVGTGCAGCPPAWADRPPGDPSWHYAAGQAGPVFVDADAVNLALTRAARVLADTLGIDVERRLAVVRVDDTLQVEAFGPEGPRHELDGLELVELVECAVPGREGRRVYVLVRLPRAGTAAR